MSWSSIGTLKYNGEYPVILHEKIELDFYAEDIEYVQEEIAEGSRVAFEANNNNFILDYEVI